MPIRSGSGFFFEMPTPRNSGQNRGDFVWLARPLLGAENGVVLEEVSCGHSKVVNYYAKSPIPFNDFIVQNMI